MCRALWVSTDTINCHVHVSLQNMFVTIVYLDHWLFPNRFLWPFWCSDTSWRVLSKLSKWVCLECRPTIGSTCSAVQLNKAIIIIFIGRKLVTGGICLFVWNRLHTCSKLGVEQHKCRIWAVQFLLGFRIHHLVNVHEWSTSHSRQWSWFGMWSSIATSNCIVIQMLH